LDVKTANFKSLTQELKVTDRDKAFYIKQLVMCYDGPYFATSDVHNCVSLFKKDYVKTQGQINQEQPQEWQFNGKMQSH